MAYKLKIVWFPCLCFFYCGFAISAGYHFLWPVGFSIAALLDLFVTQKLEDLERRDGIPD